MQVSRFYLLVVVAVVALLLAGCGAASNVAPVAAANTPVTSVTMTYEGHEGASSDGAPDIGYPYYVSINGSSTYSALICDSFADSVTVGETWKASVNPLLTNTGMFGATTSLDYRAAGLIFKSMLAGTLTPNQAQWAIWGLFSTEARSQSYFTEINAAAIESNYLNEAVTAPDSSYGGLFLYTPIAGTQSSGDGTPQEFIGYSAEGKTE